MTLESLLFSFFPVFRKKRSEKDGFEQAFVGFFAASYFSEVWPCSVPWWNGWYKVVFHTCLHPIPQLFSLPCLSNIYLIRNCGVAVLQLSAIKQSVTIATYPLFYPCFIYQWEIWHQKKKYITPLSKSCLTARETILAANAEQHCQGELMAVNRLQAVSDSCCNFSTKVQWVTRESVWGRRHPIQHPTTKRQPWHLFSFLLCIA